MIRSILTRTARRGRTSWLGRKSSNALAGRGILIDYNGDPIKSVEFRISDNASDGQLRHVPNGFLTRREGWQLQDDDTGRLWSVQAALAMMDDHTLEDWVDVFVTSIARGNQNRR